MRLIVAAAVLILLPVCGNASPDGKPLVERASAAYRALTSVSYTGSSTIFLRTARGTRSIGSTSTVRFQRPNKVFMSVTGPQAGTVTYSCDGRGAIAYSERINQYIKRPAAATLDAVINDLNKSAQPVFAVGISAVAFDMLFFLEGRPLVPAVVWTTKGAAKVDGAACNVVVGTPKGGRGFRRVTLWIDRATHLIRKSELVMAATVGQPRRTTAAQVSIVENALDLKVNPPLRDADFQINVPKSAVERDPGKYLKKP